MSKRFIGESIIDAINWTQDTLRSTRPIAEAVLFSMIKEKKAQETKDGFVLHEDDDDEDDDDHRKKDEKMRQTANMMSTRMARRTRMNFVNRRKSFDERANVLADRFDNPNALRAYALGYTNEGEKLEHPFGPEKPQTGAGTTIQAEVDPHANKAPAPTAEDTIEDEHEDPKS